MRTLTHAAKARTYIKQIESGHIDSNLLRVANYIRIYPMSTKEDVIKGLNKKHQSVTAAISNLLDVGLLTPVGLKDSRDACFTVYKWEDNPERRIINRVKRHEEKFNRWLERGRNEFTDLAKENGIEL